MTTTTIKVEAGQVVMVINEDCTAELWLPEECERSNGHWLAAGLALLVNDREWVARVIERTKAKINSAV